MPTYTQQISKLTQRYNDAIEALQNAYDMEDGQRGFMNRIMSSSQLKRQYSRQYEALVREYEQERRLIFNSYAQANPEWARWRKWWQRIFCLGLLVLTGSCMGHLASTVEDTPTPAATSRALDGSAAVTYWNADNIPIPYLQDSTQYVSNPDHVLQPTAVDRMNTTLKRLDNELGIQSVVIVVNHIENDDPFRMAQDVGNKYGVGRQDMGLVIVCGYEDHSLNISPGRKLEAELTDAECHRLEQQYAIPAMREEMPDSAMIYLTEAIYSTLQKKELPTMLLSSQTEGDDEIPIIMGIYLLLFIAWSVFFLKLNDKYRWIGLLGAASLLPNPFHDDFNSGGGFIGGGGGGGISFGGGGGGFSGGSFGGGSFGGGGATSRW